MSDRYISYGCCGCACSQTYKFCWPMAALCRGRDIMTLPPCAPSDGEQRNVASPSSFSDILTRNDWRLSCVVPTRVVAGCNVNVSWVRQTTVGVSRRNVYSEYDSIGRQRFGIGRAVRPTTPLHHYYVKPSLLKTTADRDSATVLAGRRNTEELRNVSQPVTPLLLNRCRRC